MTNRESLSLDALELVSGGYNTVLIHAEYPPRLFVCPICKGQFEPSDYENDHAKFETDHVNICTG